MRTRQLMHNTQAFQREIKIGETIEQRVTRMLVDNEPISGGAPDLFTEKGKGINPAYDIRTDKFEVMIDSLNVVHKSQGVKGDSKPSTGGNEKGTQASE